MNYISILSTSGVFAALWGINGYVSGTLNVIIYSLGDEFHLISYCGVLFFLDRIHVVSICYFII